MRRVCLSLRGRRAVPHGLCQTVIAAGVKPTDGTLPVGLLVMLVELALAIQAGEANLDADDAAQLLRDEVRRRIPHLPGLGLLGFVCARKARHDTPDEHFIIANMNHAVRVDHLVVPRRNTAMRLVLSRVPVRRDVALGAPKDNEYLGHRVRPILGPVWVGYELPRISSRR